MAAKTNKTREPGKAGTVELTETALSEADLDLVTGGTHARKTLTSQPAGSDTRNKSAVGIHEISGALVKIN